MFLLHCTVSGRDHLVGTRSFISFANGPDGPVAQARCPEGHVHEIRFRTGQATPAVSSAA